MKIKYTSTIRITCKLVQNGYRMGLCTFNLPVIYVDLMARNYSQTWMQ